MISTHPESWVYLLVIPPIVLLAMIGMIRSSRALKSLGFDKDSPQLRHYSLIRFLRSLFFLGFYLLAVISLFDLRWGREPQSSDSKGLDLAVVMDLSYSMLAKDQDISRLDTAKETLMSLMPNLEDVRYSFIPFKGEPMIAVPLTEDKVMLQRYVSMIEPWWMSSPGSNMEEAIMLAYHSLENDQDRNKAILLITDGEELSGNGLQAARFLMEQNVDIAILALGGDRPVPIPLADGTNLLSETGQEILTLQNESLLREMVHIGDGMYFNGGEAGTFSQLQRYLRELTNPVLGIRYFRPMKFRVFLFPAILMLLFNQIVGRLPWRRK